MKTYKSLTALNRYSVALTTTEKEAITDILRLCPMPTNYRLTISEHLYLKGIVVQVETYCLHSQHKSIFNIVLDSTLSERMLVQLQYENATTYKSIRCDHKSLYDKAGILHKCIQLGTIPYYGTFNNVAKPFIQLTAGMFVGGLK